MSGLRARAYLTSAVIAGAVAFLLLGVMHRDSFPVSTYPMFAAQRAAEVSIAHAVGVGPDGARWPLPPSAVANREVI